MPPVEWLLAAYAFIFGAVIGSFLNVVIYRLPRELSLVRPPSACPSCGKRIRPWHNVPVFGYIVLLGRCRDCRAPISPRYPLVELANGLFYAAAFLHIGLDWILPLVCAAISMLLCLLFIDLDEQFLPDVIDIPGIGVGLALGALRAGTRPTTLTLSASLVDSAIGAALGFLIIYTIAYIYRVIRRGEGMGQGDMKMLAMLGAIFGWQWVLPIIFIASLAGAISGLLLVIGDRERFRHGLPFGLFLGLAALTVLFFGSQLSDWYLELTVPEV